MSFGTVRCSVCACSICEGDQWFMPRNARDEQIVAIRSLYRMDALTEFVVCQDCVDLTEFEAWLDQRMAEHLATDRLKVACDWRRDGY